MSRAKFWILISTAVVLAISISAAFSNKRDDQNYRHDYVYQDTKIVGKPGVLLTALGQPEDYDFEFFNRYITLIFKTAFPARAQAPYHAGQRHRAHGPGASRGHRGV